MKALLVVDIQYDFLPGGSLAVPEGDEVIPVANQCLEMDYFDLAVATQDWHPPNHASFASNHEGHEPFETIEWRGIEQILWPDHCIQGSEGAEIDKRLNVKPFEAIIRKGTDPEIDSYSTFFDNKHLKFTGLSSYFKGRDVRDVYMVGLAGDFCVYYSIKDAIKEGFNTHLILPGTRPINKEEFEEYLLEMKDMGCEIIESLEELKISH